MLVSVAIGDLPVEKGVCGVTDHVEGVVESPLLRSANGCSPSLSGMYQSGPDACVARHCSYADHIFPNSPCRRIKGVAVGGQARLSSSETRWYYMGEVQRYQLDDMSVLIRAGLSYQEIRIAFQVASR
jgi:hypothetical protein